MHFCGQGIMCTKFKVFLLTMVFSVSSTLFFVYIFERSDRAPYSLHDLLKKSQRSMTGRFQLAAKGTVDAAAMHRLISSFYSNADQNRTEVVNSSASSTGGGKKKLQAGNWKVTDSSGSKSVNESIQEDVGPPSSQERINKSGADTEMKFDLGKSKESSVPGKEVDSGRVEGTTDLKQLTKDSNQTNKATSSPDSKLPLGNKSWTGGNQKLKASNKPDSKTPELQIHRDGDKNGSEGKLVLNKSVASSMKWDKNNTAGVHLTHHSTNGIVNGQIRPAQGKNAGSGKWAGEKKQDGGFKKETPKEVLSADKTNPLKTRKDASKVVDFQKRWDANKGDGRKPKTAQKTNQKPLWANGKETNNAAQFSGVKKAPEDKWKKEHNMNVEAKNRGDPIKVAPVPQQGKKSNDNSGKPTRDQKQVTQNHWKPPPMQEWKKPGPAKLSGQLPKTVKGNENQRAKPAPPLKQGAKAGIDTSVARNERDKQVRGNWNKAGDRNAVQDRKLKQEAPKSSGYVNGSENSSPPKISNSGNKVPGSGPLLAVGGNTKLVSKNDPVNGAGNPMMTHDFGLVLNEPLACKKADGSNKAVFLLVLVVTTHGNSDARQTIRETWASPGDVMGKAIVTLFMLGQSINRTLDKLLKSESDKYHDILVEDFIDSYRNLTLKTMMGLKWMGEYCPQASYVMKTDDDMYINRENLLSLLTSPATPTKRFVTGHVFGGMPPIRISTQKNYMPVEIYGEPKYPPYCAGAAYVMSGDVPTLVFNVATLIPKYVHIEDVLVGICLRKLGIKPIQNNGFRHNAMPFVPYSFCNYQNVITMHGATIQNMLSIWNGQKADRQSTQNKQC